jgi:hypothetical protein
MKNKESKREVRESGFDLYIPMHLRRLRYDLQRYRMEKAERSKSVLKRFRTIFET